MSNLFRVEYVVGGAPKSSAPFSKSTADILASAFSECHLYSDVRVVECVAQQPALPDIADNRWDVRADGDGGWA